MVLLQHINAYKAVKGLYEKETDYTTAYKLVGLKKKLQKSVEFYGEKEMELAKKYGKKREDGELDMTPDGKFEFGDIDDAITYKQEILKLGITEVEDIEKIKIKAPTKITPKEIEALYDFIEFEGE